MRFTFAALLGARSHSHTHTHRHTTAFFLVMFAFALSNGYISTLCFISAIELPSLDPHEVDLSGTCLALYLTLGLVVGSLACVCMHSLSLFSRVLHPAIILIALLNDFAGAFR